LSDFFDRWIFMSEYPTLGGEWTYDNSSREITITIVQKQESNLFRFPLSVGVYTEGADTPLISTFEISTRDTTLSISASIRPDSVVLDPETWLLFKNKFSQ